MVNGRHCASCRYWEQTDRGPIEPGTRGNCLLEAETIESLASQTCRCWEEKNG